MGGIIQPWNVNELAPVVQMNVNQENISGSLAWFPDGATLAVAGSSSIWLYKIDTTQLENRILNTLDDEIAAIAVSPDNRVLAYGGKNATIYLWGVQTGTLLATLPGHTDSITSIGYSPDGVHLASVGRGDTTIRIWNYQSGSQISTLKHADTDSILCTAYTKDGRLLVSAGLNGVLYLWDVASNAEITTWEGHNAVIMSIALHPSQNILASADVAGTIKLWSTDTHTEISALQHAEGIRSIAFNRTGTILASGGLLDRTVNLWDMSTYTKLAALSVGSTGALNVAFSPKETVLATSTEDGLVQLWMLR